MFLQQVFSPPFSSASSLHQEPCPCPITTTFSSLFPHISCFFSAILGILFLVLLSVAYGVLCSPFCRLPRSLSNFMTIFLPLCPSFPSGLLHCSPLFQCSLPFCLSISFLLCMKKKWKSISCNPLFYFSNEKAHQ